MVNYSRIRKWFAHGYDGHAICMHAELFWLGLYHGPLTRYVKLWVAHAPGMPGTFSPPSGASDPDMHHGTCVTHVPWCMPGSLTSGFPLESAVRENVPGIPGACATRHVTYLVRGPCFITISRWMCRMACRRCPSGRGLSVISQAQVVPISFSNQNINVPMTASFSIQTRERFHPMTLIAATGLDSYLKLDSNR